MEEKKSAPMNGGIKNVLMITWLVVTLSSQWVLASLSPQYTEFLKLMFWEFPKVIVKSWLSWIPWL